MRVSNMCATMLCVAFAPLLGCGDTSEPLLGCPLEAGEAPAVCKLASRPPKGRKWVDGGAEISLQVQVTAPGVRPTDGVEVQLIASAGTLQGKEPGQASALRLLPFSFASQENRATRAGIAKMRLGFCDTAEVLSTIDDLEHLRVVTGSAAPDLMLEVIADPAGVGPHRVQVSAKPTDGLVLGEPEAFLRTSRGRLGPTADAKTSTTSVKLIATDLRSRTILGETNLFLDVIGDSTLLSATVNGRSVQLMVQSGVSTSTTRPGACN